MGEEMFPQYFRASMSFIEAVAVYRHGPLYANPIPNGRTEHTAILAANPTRTFIPEARVDADTVGILRDVESTLDWELSRTARSSNLAMPERVRTS